MDCLMGLVQSYFCTPIESEGIAQLFALWSSLSPGLYRKGGLSLSMRTKDAPQQLTRCITDATILQRLFCLPWLTVFPQRHSAGTSGRQESGQIDYLVSPIDCRVGPSGGIMPRCLRHRSKRIETRRVWFSPIPLQPKQD